MRFHDKVINLCRQIIEWPMSLKMQILRAVNEKTQNARCIYGKSEYFCWRHQHISRNTFYTGDKGCAEACTEHFSALKDQHWRHVVSSLSHGHFRNVFVKSSEISRILIFYLSLKAWEEKSLPKSHLGWSFLVFGEGKATKENISIFWFIWPLSQRLSMRTNARVCIMCFEPNTWSVGEDV